MAKGLETPEDRVAHQVVVTLRRIQATFTLQDVVHASHGDFANGIRKSVRRETLLAQLEILKVPYARWEAERRRIAKELSEIDE